MKATYLASVRPLNNSLFWLLGIAAGLIAIHLTLTWRIDDFNLLSSSLLFWFSVSSLVWKKRNSLLFESGVISSFLGILLVAIVLWKSAFLPGAMFLQVSPIISALGLALVASGFKGLKQYWQELVILLFLGIPNIVLPTLINLSELTAKFTTFILWYSGFEVSRSGINITLPTGGIEVYPDCSGMESVIYLLGIAVLVLMLFPIDWGKKFFVPIVAVFLGFVINGVRVALMAVLVAASRHEAFEYWHTGNGSLIFSMLSVLLFGLFCLFLIQPAEPENQTPVEF